MSKLYNWANVIIFTVIWATMVTVSASAVRFAFNIPAQLNWYPTNFLFVLIVGMVVVFVAIYGLFNADYIEQTLEVEQRKIN